MAALIAYTTSIPVFFVLFHSNRKKATGKGGNVHKRGICVIRVVHGGYDSGITSVRVMLSRRGSGARIVPTRICRTRALGHPVHFYTKPRIRPLPTHSKTDECNGASSSNQLHTLPHTHVARPACQARPACCPVNPKNRFDTQAAVSNLRPS